MNSKFGVGIYKTYIKLSITDILSDKTIRNYT